MKIEDRLRVVKLAEIQCEAHAEKARAAWQHAKLHAREAATPWRIVTVGAIGGFLMGRSGGAAGAPPGVGAKLFGTIAQSLVTSLGASFTAGAAASSAAEAAAVATSDAISEGSEPAQARVEGTRAAGLADAALEAEFHRDA